MVNTGNQYGCKGLCVCANDILYKVVCILIQNYFTPESHFVFLMNFKAACYFHTHTRTLKRRTKYNIAKVFSYWIVAFHSCRSLYHPNEYRLWANGIRWLWILLKHFPFSRLTKLKKEYWTVNSEQHTLDTMLRHFNIHKISETEMFAQYSRVNSQCTVHQYETIKTNKFSTSFAPVPTFIFWKTMVFLYIFALCFHLISAFGFCGVDLLCMLELLLFLTAIFIAMANGLNIFLFSFFSSFHPIPYIWPNSRSS